MGRKFWTPKADVRSTAIADLPPAVGRAIEAATVSWRPLNLRQARRVEMGSFGAMLTGLTGDEFKRFQALDRNTDRSVDDDDKLRRDRRRRSDPSRYLDLRRAVLFAVRAFDGEAVEPAKDADAKCWVDELPAKAVIALGVMVVDDAGLLGESDEAAGNGGRASGAP